MIVTVYHYFILSVTVFMIGLLGIVINRRSLIMILMSLELILLSANINFVAFSSYMGDLKGQVYVMFILATAAAEAAIGLAILIVYFRTNRDTNVDSSFRLRG